jgi:hypothetical protein
MRIQRRGGKYDAAALASTSREITGGNSAADGAGGSALPICHAWSHSAERSRSVSAAASVGSEGDGKGGGEGEGVFVLSREGLQAMMDDAAWSSRLKAFGNALTVTVTDRHSVDTMHASWCRYYRAEDRAGGVTVVVGDS